MNTYNIDNVLRDYNTLLDLYLNSSSEEKKINIYSQMLFIYNIEPKLVKGSKLFSYKPSNYSIYTRERESARKKRYLELDNLTRKICFNLWEEINKYYPLDTSRVPNDIYSYEEYVSMLRTFFKENFPSDLELFNKDIEELSAKIKSLNKEKISLNIDAVKAQQTLRDLQQQFKNTGNAADQMVLQLANANYSNVNKQIERISKSSQQAKRELSNLVIEYSKADNRAGMFGNNSTLSNTVIHGRTGERFQNFGSGERSQSNVNDYASIGADIGNSRSGYQREGRWCYCKHCFCCYGNCFSSCCWHRIGRAGRSCYRWRNWSADRQVFRR